MAPEQRRSGLGRRLMQTGEQHLAAQGSVAITLEVATDNFAAQAFYASMGYVETGRIPGYYDDGGDALVMRKELQTTVAEHKTSD